MEIASKYVNVVRKSWDGVRMIFFLIELESVDESNKESFISFFRRKQANGTIIVIIYHVKPS